MNMPDDREIELKRPNTIEEALACIAYLGQVADQIDVQIVMMTELMHDICSRVIALEGSQHD
jgi:hypothetical protein